MLALTLLTTALLLATRTAAFPSRSPLVSRNNGQPQPPPQLWSPLVAQKFAATAQPVSRTQYPQFTTRDTGVWVDYGVDYWTSGFLPAALYAMHAREQLCPGLAPSPPVDWLELGREWSAGLRSLEVRNTVGHDVGFISFPFVEELKIHPNNETAKDSIKAFGRILADRYNPVVGCTRSWDTSDPTDFQVIIDNMINMELFFINEQLTGNSTFRQMALTHADQTMRWHIRPDGGTYHVVEFNSTTGAVIKRRTSQGYADWSTWSRGQAWAIYGFANMHTYTNNVTFLETARKLADYFIEHVPADGVVPWDFQAPLSPPRPADSSASMVATNGLLLLAQRELALSPPNPAGAKHWTDAALKLLNDNAKFAWKPEWESLLANGTVNNPASNNLTGIIYGDMYFVRAGNTLLEMNLAHCPS